MSDNVLKLIPTDPAFVPELAHQLAAREMLALWMPRADKVEVATVAQVMFVDAGGNWEGVFCPACGADLEKNDNWGQLMDQAYETQFFHLELPMPCCGSICSLNDLRYGWPMGFARFVLEALNPGGQLTPEQIAALSSILRCVLREVWAHY